MALLEEVRKYVTVEVGFEVLYAQAMPSVEHSLLLWPVVQDSELSAPPQTPYLSACHHVSHHDNNGIKF